MIEMASETSELALPSVTRMLLRADGSTTLLLEALVGQRLSLGLVDQRETAAGELSGAVRTALNCADGDTVIVRRSVLRAGESAVSANSVVIAGAERDLTDLLAQREVPIGHSLAAAGRHLGRTVLATGRALWPADDAADAIPCACKESVLLDHTATAVAYLHERFNPAYVPVGVRS
ncbi:hypothetical protein BJY24_006435 [Nocardia transvalensis]|uniref:Uncharacterized protein n=1 Tax=Nocardia transvalensis TaxID=37333 RepID=A0A7W9ULG0_9NOCA|nr:chorismate pyruvate-lyase family protein [Nocardia transvalensis]MBB5917523.1 hypothetical protein [Nocardia transvalensis]